ncbi:uracil-DNA glycosylase [Alcaligenaceae bacterium LF4-65]|uniref:Type-4 uracil-DNA glycosylase n=1 Tax=Zwartia hollandica TaxID=324606 RepID=A0A953NBT6_9BURK|nr:uracil-DNA glycosylase [Zwartia hollandica]MBZ1351462.1 uracil-DNA glycosylase [Zwartia hollandica]
MNDTRPATLSLTSLQLAWLAELGIEKPWVPASTATVAQAGGVSVQQTPAAIRPAKPMSSAVAAKVLNQATPSPERVEALSDLAALKAAVQACTSCGLCSARQQAVMGEGVTQPAIMVVGEAPGEQDDRQGQAFVGRPGVLLDNMLAAIQSGRGHDAYVTTIIKCRPTGNRNPRPEEVAACQPYLMREIALQQPFTILALGRFAAQALLGSEEPLQTLRERTHSIQVGGRTIPLVVSYNPSYLLSHPNEKAAAWKDLQRIKALCRGPLVQFDPAA